MTTTPEHRQHTLDTTDPTDPSPGADQAGRIVILKPGDNVAVVVAPAPIGGLLYAVSGESVELIDDVPRGHKVALSDIPKGTGVLKYGEVIGVTTQDVRRGEHVHVHNVESQRLRGDLAGEGSGHLGARDGD